MDSAAPSHKEHYTAIILGVGALALVFFLMQRSGSGGGYTSLGPSASEQSSLLQAQSAQNASQDALQATISSNATAAFTNYVNQTDALSAKLAEIQAGVTTARNQAQSATDIAVSHDNAQVSIAGLQSSAAVSTAQSAADAVSSAASSSAYYGAQAAASTANAAIAVSKNQAQAAANSNPGNSAGGILSGIGNLFGGVAKGLFGFLSPSSPVTPAPTSTYTLGDSTINAAQPGYSLGAPASSVL